MSKNSKEFMVELGDGMGTSDRIKLVGVKARIHNNEEVMF